MKSVAETDLFNGEERLALHLARRAIKAVIEPEGVRYRCHEIARAVALQRFVFGTVEDGNCAGAEHSWIRLDTTGNILDPYVVWRLPMVQLVDVRSVNLQRDLYRTEAMRTDIDLVLVVTLAQVMREALGDPPPTERSIMDPSSVAGIVVAGLSSEPRPLTDFVVGLDIGTRPALTNIQIKCMTCGLMTDFEFKEGEEVSNIDWGRCHRCETKLEGPKPKTYGDSLLPIS